MSRQLRVLVIPREHIKAYLLGQARVRNLPPDADVLGAESYGAQLGILVYSDHYDCVPPRKQIPCSPAVIERLDVRRAA